MKLNLNAIEFFVCNFNNVLNIQFFLNNLKICILNFVKSAFTDQKLQATERASETLSSIHDNQNLVQRPRINSSSME